MNATEFEELLMTMTLLNCYYDFMEKLMSLDMNEFTDEQNEKLKKMCETRKNENDKDKEVRQDAMKMIMSMSYEQFEQAIQFNILPPFVRACRYDDDFVNIFRDTNHQQGMERAYIHRAQLVQTERNTFIANNILSIEEADEYEKRQQNMEIIFNMNEEEFEEALKNDLLPAFVRAKVGDPDYVFLYREHSAQQGYEYAFWNRQKLRTVEIEHFKRICGINY